MVAAAPTLAEEAVVFPHQADLPPLPVPTLEDTCARYLDTVRPLLSEAELQHTEAVVAEVCHTGLESQTGLLLTRANQGSNTRQVCYSHA